MIDLGVLFTPLTVLINRRLAEQTPARELAAQLEGETMAVRVADTGLAAYLQVVDGRVRLATRFDDEPSVILSGSPIALGRLAGSDPGAVLREGRVQVSGDAVMAFRFQALLKLAAPDWEDELSNFVGDSAAHQAGALARGLTNVAGKVSDRLQETVGEYLTERQGALPTQAQFAEFRQELESLRDDLARAEARARILAQRFAGED